jgi:hypothetical protein
MNKLISENISLIINKDNKEISYSILLIIMTIFQSIFYLSDIINSIGLKFLFVSPIIVIITFYYINYKHRKVKIWVLPFFLILFFTFIFVALFHSDLYILYFPGNVIVSLFFILILSRKEIELSIKIGTFIIILFSIGGIIAFFYSAGVGIPEPTSVYLSSSGRSIGYFLTSFGWPQWTPFGYFLRSSAIYDEPGAFSFLICFFVVFRDLFKLNRNITILILFLGLITFSLAHYIFIFLYLIKEIKIKNIIFLVILLIIITYFFISYGNILTDFLQYSLENRFMSSSEGLFSNNNRISHMQEDLNVIYNNNIFTTLFGNYHSNCCNFLFPYAQFGIFGSWVYYIFLFFLIYQSIKHKNILIFGIFLLWLQRPSIGASGYTFLASLLVVILINDNLFGKIRKTLI